MSSEPLSGEQNTSRHVRSLPGTSGSAWFSTALAALRRWWSVGRHYRPERRYMRGGQGHDGVSAAGAR